MQKTIWSIVASAGIWLSTAAYALPKITVEKINGFEVHFVDVGRGDTFGASYQIPLGTLNETREQMGRAHLLEHVMHNGSRAYPGKKAYDELLKPIGVDTNAMTSYSQTFYYAVAPESKAETLLNVFFAPLGGLDWNQESFVGERDVVINEIVSEGMKKDGRVFNQMPFTQLLYPENPWHHAPLGDFESLSKMTLNDLKELYYVNYVPKNIRVSIQGNFSDPKFFAQVREWTKKALVPFHVGQDPQHFVPKSGELLKKPTPSFFSNSISPTEGERRLYIQSEASKLSSILFEVDLKQNPVPAEAFTLLAEYLKLNAPGSLAYKLNTELGWVSGSGMQLIPVGQKLHVIFYGELTEQGLNHVSDINTLMLEALRSIQLNGPSTDAIQLLKESYRNSLEKSALSVPSFIETYSDFLDDPRPIQSQLDAIANVTPDEIARAARQISPLYALYVNMGPEIADMDTDPIYKRKFKLEDNRADLKKYMAVWDGVPSQNYTPKLRAVELPPVPAFAGRSFIQSRPEEFLKLRATLDFRDDLPDTAVAVSLNLAPESVEELIASDLVLAAFNERYIEPLSYLHYKGVTVAWGRNTNVLQFSSTGNSNQTLGAQQWILNELAHFVPTREELVRAQEKVATDLNDAYASAFTYNIAVWKMAAQVDPLYRTNLESRDMVRALDLDKVHGQWTRLLRASNKEYVMVGPFSQQGYENLLQTVGVLSPLSLDDKVTQQIWARGNWNTPSDLTHMPLTEKNSESIGLVRAYRGPLIRNIKESAAFAVLGNLLEGKIKGRNRDDFGLGYVHGATNHQLDNVHSHLLLLGQTDSPDKGRKTIEGWEQVLSELKSGKFSDQDYRDAISGVLNAVAQQKTRASQFMAAYSLGQKKRFDALANEKVIAALREMGPSEVREIAERYIFADDVKPMQLTTGKL